MKELKINEELLREVANAILLNYRAFSMESWLERKKDSPCGTAACIGGWAVLLANGNKKPSDMAGKKTAGDLIAAQVEIAQMAAVVLGMPYPYNHEFADRLFLVRMWPEEFREAYCHAVFLSDGDEALALIAAARIEHFIATGGKE